MRTASLLLLSALSLRAQNGPHLAPLRAKVSFENVAMPFPGEVMGLTGLNLLRDFSNGAYLGITSYGSLTGERGGFITAGVSAGWRAPLSERITLDLGGHAGGGGAGRAAVGGGMMLRAHAGFDVQAAGLRWGLEYAKTRFPNGDIDSSAWSLSVALPFRTWVAPETIRSWPIANLPGAGLGHASLALTAQRYTPMENVKLLNGPLDREPVDLVGLLVTADLNRWSFLALDMAAAGRGKADGYMEILVGLGARVNLTAGGGLRAYGRIGVGPAGGGNLDVGGGTAFRAAVGLEARTGGGFLLGAEAGALTTPGASFRVNTLQLKVGRHFTYLRPGGEALPATAALESKPWGLRLGVLRLQAPQRRGGAEALPIEMASIQMDSFLNEYCYFTGQGAFGMTGKAGGFALGFVGFGLRSGPMGSWGPRAFLDVLVGAAGGGGVDTGGGAVAMPMVGLEQQIGAGLSLQLKGGRVKTRKGSLDTSSLELAVAYRFGLLHPR